MLHCSAVASSCERRVAGVGSGLGGHSNRHDTSHAGRRGRGEKRRRAATEEVDVAACVCACSCACSTHSDSRDALSMEPRTPVRRSRRSRLHPPACRCSARRRRHAPRAARTYTHAQRADGAVAAQRSAPARAPVLDALS
eukprot:scaffold30764_cov112-Isochrysis_galbana.AAC.2